MIKYFISLVFIGFVFSMPASAASPAVLDVQKVTTPAGIEVWLVEDKTVPVISMHFSFDGGLAYDPEGMPGVGRLVSILLDEGAGEMKSQAFQAELSRNAIRMGFSSGRDAFEGSLKTLKVNKKIAFDLLAKALNSPRFDEDAIIRMKNANISKIKDDMGDPSWLVARTFNGSVFEGHNYGRPGFGNLESMKKIDRKDLLNFVRAQFAKDVLKVSIAGDITKDEAVQVVDSIFAALPEKAEETDTSAATLKNAGKTLLLPLDAPQTYIIAGHSGVNNHHADWQAAVVMNFILGGGSFDARLMKEIRDKRGLTYGVYSSLHSMNHADLLQVNLSASNDKVKEAVEIIREEWQKLATEGPTAEEVQNAKSYLTGSLLLELTSTDDISNVLNGLQKDKFDSDYINQRNAMIEAVTAEDVKRVAARLLKSEDLTVVLVGQPKGIDPDILLDRAPGMTSGPLKP